MRRSGCETTNGGRAVVAGSERRSRGPLAAVLALLLLVIGLLADLPRRSWSEADSAAAISDDCARHDRRPSPGEPDRDACHFGGLCCAAGCGGPVAVDASPAPRAFARYPGTTRGVGRYAARQDFLALAGWASAWSSRAPPFLA